MKFASLLALYTHHEMSLTLQHKTVEKIEKLDTRTTVPNTNGGNFQIFVAQ